MKLTSIPDAEWQQVEAAAMVKFWDEIAAESETKAKVVEIFKKYNRTCRRPGGHTATPSPGTGHLTLWGGRFLQLPVRKNRTLRTGNFFE
jgi:hypothetical protein